MAARDLSILIIDENKLRAAIIEDGLREAGHQTVAVPTASRTRRARSSIHRPTWW